MISVISVRNPAACVITTRSRCVPTGVNWTRLWFARGAAGVLVCPATSAHPLPFQHWTWYEAGVRQRLLGTTAVTHLFAALSGTPASGVVRQPCRLVVRESTA
ncbi:hypothetical protein LFM09_10610 [Lentzea alba]|uniref:hypothetical protein n=1 Tax=Lentzea alba TaxID=2714351 RepID=UPI0039BF519C